MLALFNEKKKLDNIISEEKEKIKIQSLIDQIDNLAIKHTNQIDFNELLKSLEKSDIYESDESDEDEETDQIYKSDDSIIQNYRDAIINYIENDDINRLIFNNINKYKKYSKKKSKYNSKNRKV